MKFTPVWHGVVDGEAKLHVEAGALFRSYLARLKNKRVRLVLKKEDRPKTRSQTGYLFGVLYPIIADACGYREYEIGQVHDALMRKLRGVQPDPNPLKLRVSLAAMSMEEVSLYIEDVRLWALESHGIVTPDADKVVAA